MNKETQIKVITYEEERLNYFTDLMKKSIKRYKRLFKKFKDAPMLSAEYQALSDAGREAQFHGDIVEMLENGYRKQEWISVDERLPELEDGRNWGNHRPRSIRVLCVCQQRSGKTFVKEGYYELFSNKPCWRIPGSIDSVTHWMPLPEAPKMKGGAE